MRRRRDVVRDGVLHGAIAVVFCLAAAWAAGPVHADDASAVGVKSIAVEGTLLAVTLTDGRVLRSPDLIGAKLVINAGDHLLRVRIDGIERDPEDRRSAVAAEDVVWLHSLSVESADGAYAPLCEAGPDGRRQAIPVAGRLHAADNRFVRGEGGAFELACTAGAMGKCLRLGYHPWAKSQPGAAPLQLYQTCLRLMSADYGGLGAGTTRNGMRITLYAAGGLGRGYDPAMTFEAGWTQDGAVCVHHPRVRENITLSEIEARWPRLAGLTGAKCTEEFARAHGALLFNRSAQ